MFNVRSFNVQKVMDVLICFNVVLELEHSYNRTILQFTPPSPLSPLLVDHVLGQRYVVPETINLGTIIIWVISSPDCFFFLAPTAVNDDDRHHHRCHRPKMRHHCCGLHPTAAPDMGRSEGGAMH
jgi:hypothetical protein